VADRIRRALDVIPAERLVINPDCGCVPAAEVAFRKLASMAGRLVGRNSLDDHAAGRGARTRPFSIVVELVASGLKREAQVRRSPRTSPA
jgi:hypothetical protein